MTQQYWDRLIEGHLDGILSEAEQAEFAALVRDSEAARRRFWDLSEVHGLARDAARIAWPEQDVVVVRPSAQHPWRAVSLAWRRLGLVAAGLVLGVLMSGLSWAITRPQWAASKTLLDEGFEEGAAPVADGVPTTPGQWSGDVTEVVAARDGVQPSGAKMLRFLRSDFTGKPNPGGYISEIYHLIDLREQRTELAADDAVVQISAQFNAAPFPDNQSYLCAVSVYALDGDTATNGMTRQSGALHDQSLATSRRSNQLLDRNPATWQRVATELRLPPSTDFLLLRIAMAHGVPTRTSDDRTTFPAHFVDDLRVTFARRPLLP